MFYYYYDWTYILVLIGVVLSLLASAKVKSTFARYSNVRSYSGMTGRDAAEKILHRNGIYDVQIIHISGNLTDHYNPTNKTLALSDPVIIRLPLQQSVSQHMNVVMQCSIR